MTRYCAEALERKRVANESKFLAHARDKFGNRFDYSLIEYHGQKIAVSIICPEHGEFKQTPDKHLQSELGCPKCGINRRAALKAELGRVGFLNEFQKKFGNRIELLTAYTKARESIRCRCNVHGIEFEATPDRLIQWKHGCPVCAKEETKTALTISQDEFLRRAREKFGEQFDLSSAIYSGMSNRVAITCPLHGEFRTTPVSFLNNTHGCPKCARLYIGYTENRIKALESGLTKSRPTTLAVMKVEVFGIIGYKVGTTARTLISRYRDALREIIFETTLDELDALKLEQTIHAEFFRSRDTRIFLAGLRNRERWPGDTELYEEVAIPEIIEQLIKAVAAIERNSAEYWQSNVLLKPPRLEVRSVRKTPGSFTAAKPVIRLDTLERFSSATAAAAAVGTTQGNISAVCLGIKAAIKGIRFAYVVDYEAQSTQSH